MRCREQVWHTGKVIDVRDAARRVSGWRLSGRCACRTGKGRARRGTHGRTGNSRTIHRVCMETGDNTIDIFHRRNTCWGAACASKRQERGSGPDGGQERQFGVTSSLDGVSMVPSVVADVT